MCGNLFNIPLDSVQNLVLHTSVWYLALIPLIAPPTGMIVFSDASLITLLTWYLGITYSYICAKPRYNNKNWIVCNYHEFLFQKSQLRLLYRFIEIIINNTNPYLISDDGLFELWILHQSILICMANVVLKLSIYNTI